MTTRLIETAAAAVISGSVTAVCGAQTPDADVMNAATQIVAEIETQACDLSLHGTPQLDDLTDRWLVAYSGVGAACDEMGEALQRAGVAAEITFYRRPNADEVMALIGKMRAAVRRGYPCMIVVKGDPQFEEDVDLWAVRYYASGQYCDDASAELERKGREFRVAFRRVR